MYFVTVLLQICKYGSTGAEALKTAVGDLFMNQLQIQD